MRGCAKPLFMLLALLAPFDLIVCERLNSAPDESRRNFDPAAWGSDHVNKPVPEYITGDECLFCHRNDIGTTWNKNRHQLTLREADPDSPAILALQKAPALKPFADDIKLLLGHKQRVRFLKPAAKHGKLDMLTTAWGGDKLLDLDRPNWDGKKFGESCAGCHTTGVDSRTRTFAALSIDCFACHGDATLDHSKDTSLMHLSKKRNDPPRVVTSICAQCHIRAGKSKSSGLPYANNFVAGDNLFRDFQVDFSDKHLAGLNPADRHIAENVRDVVVFGKESVTCLSCHDVHKQSSKKHRLVRKSDYCLNCHHELGPKKVLKKYEVHSDCCGY